VGWEGVDIACPTFNFVFTTPLLQYRAQFGLNPTLGRLKNRTEISSVLLRQFIGGRLLDFSLLMSVSVVRLMSKLQKNRIQVANVVFQSFSRKLHRFLH